MTDRDALCVVADQGYEDRARMLAQHLGVVFSADPPDHGLLLSVTAQQIELRDAAHPATRPIFVDFQSADIKKRLRAGKKGTLARAIGLSKRSGLSVFDATCGLARDSAVLMGLGCSLLGCERQPVLQILLEDGIQRAATLPRWQGLIKHDASVWLDQQDDPVADVIYMDPMFGGSRSALPKWEMQSLHSLAGDDEDAGQLLKTARDKARQRVVVKRHPRGPELAPPDLQVRGKRARFDIYLSGLSDFK